MAVVAKFTSRINASITDGAKEFLQRKAEQLQISDSALVREAVMEYLTKHGYQEND